MSEKNGFNNFRYAAVFAALYCLFCATEVVLAAWTMTTKVTSPAYCSDISGNTTVNFNSPGMTSAIVKCWRQDATYGHDSTWPAITLDGSGNGSFVFPADIFPHGPLDIRIYCTATGKNDQCDLQLYNTGGVSWNEGVPAAPGQAAGMLEVFKDDFDVMPSISATGIGVTYWAHKNGDFSDLPFSDPTGAKNPFLQRDTYLRIRGDVSKGSTGLLNSYHQDGAGFAVINGYFECRFIAPYVKGSWPAWWTLSDANAPGASGADELDIIEAYGTQGTGNGYTNFHITPHIWGGSGTAAGAKVIEMGSVGGKAAWAVTPHIYGCMVGKTNTTYYLDNVQVFQHASQPNSKIAPTYFLVNLAIGGGGWAYDLSRFNGIVDMYVDYVRVFKPNDDPKLPYINQASGIYSDSIVVTMQVGAGVTVRYTIDGSTPTASSPQFGGSLTLKNSCNLKAMGFLNGASSSVSSSAYTIIHSTAKLPSGGLLYRYYEYDAPVWDSLKALSALTSIKTGMVDSFNLAMKPAARNDRFAVRFNGVIKIDAAGDYTFWSYSDAGSKLYIGDYCVVNNDGQHTLTALKSGTIPLKQGYYTISLDYFQDTASSGLIVYYQGPGIVKTKIPKAVLSCDSTGVAVRMPPADRISGHSIRLLDLGNNSLAIYAPGMNPFTVQIMSVNGRTLKRFQAAGKATFAFPRQEFKSGIYLVQVSCGSEKAIKTMGISYE